MPSFPSIAVNRETKVLILRRNAGFKLARAFSSLASVAAVIRQ